MPPALDKDAKIPCATPQQLQSELDALTSILELGEREDTWEKMERALVRFAGITRGGGYKHLPLYTDGIGRSGAGLAITACMLSDRGRLSGVATDLVQTLAPRLGHAFAPLVSVYLPAMVTLLGRPNKVFLKRAEKCLSTIVTHCQLVTILVELRRGLSDDAATCRRGCSAGLLRALEEWPAENFGQKGVQVIEEALRKVGTDKDVEVRAAGKKIYVRYCEVWPERVDEFADPLTPTIRRYLGVGAKARAVGAAPSKPIRRPLPISKPPAPVQYASNTHEAEVAVSHHRVQALGGPTVRAVQATLPHATAPARRSPQKTAGPLAGPSRMVAPPPAPAEPLHHAEPAAVRVRVRSGKYPDTLAVSAQPAARPNIFAPTEPVQATAPAHAPYGRSISHTVLPTGSLMSPESAQPVQQQHSHNGLGHAFRPVLATSSSTISLPAVPSVFASAATDGSSEQHEPVRRFAAPATRIVRPTSTEDSAPHAPTTPGFALRGAVRPAAAFGAAGPAPGGRLGLGQAQRRVISAPTPAQIPPPEVEFTPMPMPMMKSAAASGMGGEAEKEEDVFGLIEVKQSGGAPTESESKPEETLSGKGDAQIQEEEEPLIDLSSDPSRRPEHAPVQAEPAQVSGMGEPASATEIDNAVPELAPTAIALPASPVKQAPATAVATAPAPIAAEAPGPSRAPRKAGLPAAARRPAIAPAPAARSVSATSKAAAAAVVPTLPPVRSTKLRVQPAEARPKFKPTSSAGANGANLAGSTGGMSRSASGSTTLSAGAGSKATTRPPVPAATAAAATRAMPPPKAPPAADTRAVKKLSRPPGPPAPRAPSGARAAVASRSVSATSTANGPTRTASVNTAASAVPRAAPPPGYARPTASGQAGTGTAKSRGISALTAPTAASARRAAERVVSGSASTNVPKAESRTGPAITAKMTLPPVRKERVKLKAAMPSFQPVRGRNAAGSGPALTTATATTASSRAASSTGRPGSPVAAAGATRIGVVAKVKMIPTAPLPSAVAPETMPMPIAVEVPLPASPGTKPTEVPLPGSPVVEYRGAVKVKKQEQDVTHVQLAMDMNDVDVLGQGPGAEERGDITEQETEPKRENEQDIDLDDMCSAPDTPKQGEEAHEQAPATPSRDAQNAETDASFDRTPTRQSSPVSSPGRVDESPVHFRSNHARLYDDDDSEEEEQELIEVRLAPVETAPLVMDHSIQVEAAEDLAAVITEEGAQEGEEKDLIEFSSSSRPSQFSAATSPTAMPTSQRPQTPHELPASKSVRGEDSPRVVLTEKDRNHSPVDVLLLSKTPGKGMNSNTQMADVADKMRTLTFGAHGRDAASENGTVDVDMDVDMSIEVDE